MNHSIVHDYFARAAAETKTSRPPSPCKMCENCQESTQLVDEFQNTCTKCGTVVSEHVDPSNVSFSHWVDYSPIYKRSRRVKALLEEMNGTNAVPSETLMYVLEEATRDGAHLNGCLHQNVRDILAEAPTQHRKWQHRICSIVHSLGLARHSPLGPSEIKRISMSFDILDSMLVRKHNVKVSFTVLLPVLLCLHGRADKLRCCKPVSDLLRKKYLGKVLECVVKHKEWPTDMWVSLEPLNQFFGFCIEEETSEETPETPGQCVSC